MVPLAWPENLSRSLFLETRRHVVLVWRGPFSRVLFVRILERGQNPCGFWQTCNRPRFRQKEAASKSGLATLTVKSANAAPNWRTGGKGGERVRVARQKFQKPVPARTREKQGVLGKNARPDDQSGSVQSKTNHKIRKIRVQPRDQGPR